VRTARRDGVWTQTADGQILSKYLNSFHFYLVDRMSSNFENTQQSIDPFPHDDVEPATSPPLRTPKAYLEWKGKEFPLFLGTNVVGKRQQYVNVWLAQNSVSDKHATIEIEEDGDGFLSVSLRDLLSTNGTFVQSPNPPSENESRDGLNTTVKMKNFVKVGDGRVSLSNGELMLSQLSFYSSSLCRYKHSS
jgi:hypothetical protein